MVRGKRRQGDYKVCLLHFPFHRKHFSQSNLNSLRHPMQRITFLQWWKLGKLRSILENLRLKSLRRPVKDSLPRKNFRSDHLWTGKLAPWQRKVAPRKVMPPKVFHIGKIPCIWGLFALHVQCRCFDKKKQSSLYHRMELFDGNHHLTSDVRDLFSFSPFPFLLLSILTFLAHHGVPASLEAWGSLHCRLIWAVEACRQPFNGPTQV